MKEMIKLNPVFKTMVWGGNRMRGYFGYEIPGENTGEAWVVSAHPQGDCLISEGMFAGKASPGCGRIIESYLEILKGKNFRCW